MAPAALLSLSILFLAVALSVYAVGMYAFPQKSGSPANADAAGSGPPPPQEWVARITAVTGPLARLALPSDGNALSATRLRFLNAGLRHPAWPSAYFAAKAALALALPAVALLLVGLINPFGADQALAGIPGPRARQLTLLLLLMLATLGYLLPTLLLELRARHCQRRLEEALPDAIDLMIVCLEAGLGLDAAIDRTAAEIRLRSPALADELHLVSLELRIGAGRSIALHNFAERTGLEEARSFVVMLNQADRFGTGIADSLRVHAEGLRTRRRQRAEEAAAKIPLKLLFPLIFCIFPSLLLVLVGPAAISISHVFLKSVAAR